jgi:hypothetical protein
MCDGQLIIETASGDQNDDAELIDALLSGLYMDR